MYIEDIFFMDKIFEIEKNISLHNNKPVTNLSYWNPSNVYTDMMLETLTPQSITDIFEYVYTYDIPIETRNAIIEKLTGTPANTQMCMLLPNSTLSIINMVRNLKPNKYLFGIYSPHKSLFFNSFKFSAIICDKSNDDFLEQWVDVIGGALPGSCISAIKHFLSPNYDLCTQKAKKWFEQSKSRTFGS